MNGWHRMRGGTACAMPRYWIFIDCETWPHRLSDDPGYRFHMLRLGVARFARWEGDKWTRVKECVFHERSELWRFIESCIGKRYTTWIAAHNLGFDLTVAGFWKLLNRGRVKFMSPGFSRHKNTKRKGEQGRDGALVVPGDPPTIFGVEFANQGRCLALDSLNFWRMPLASLGDCLGLEKLSIDFDNCTDEELTAYCRRDVEIVQEAFAQLMHWLKENQLGSLKWTAPAQAMQAFRTRFMTTAPIIHDEMDVRALERDAYYGGQTECFYQGRVASRVYQYDVNSLYPYVMQGNLFPVRLIAWNMKAELSTRQPDLYVQRAIAEVELDTGSEIFPKRHKGIPYYVCGNFVTTLAGPELARAHRCGYIKRWGKWATYEVAPLFDEFVAFFWEQRQRFRQDGNTAWSLMAKMMLNSLYGKFGQRSPSWVYRPDIIAEEPWLRWYRTSNTTGETRRFQCIGKYTFELVEGGEHKKACPAIAAFTTAYAREYMRRLRIIAGSRQCYYQATDSLAVSIHGAQRLMRTGLIDADQMGRLKLEAVGETADFWAANHYRIGNKYVHSGRKLKSEPLSDGGWLEDQFEGLARVFEGKGQDWIKVQTVAKRSRSGYRKGHVRNDGTVEPFRLTNDPELIEAMLTAHD